MTAGWPSQAGDRHSARPANGKRSAQADAALAAAGTVLFELALTGIPTIATYKTDIFIRLMLSRIKTWSARCPT